MIQVSSGFVFAPEYDPEELIPELRKGRVTYIFHGDRREADKIALKLSVQEKKKIIVIPVAVFVFPEEIPKV